MVSLVSSTWRLGLGRKWIFRVRIWTRFWLKKATLNLNPLHTCHAFITKTTSTVETSHEHGTKKLRLHLYLSAIPINPRKKGISASSPNMTMLILYETKYRVLNKLIRWTANGTEGMIVMNRDQRWISEELVQRFEHFTLKLWNWKICRSFLRSIQLSFNLLLCYQYQRQPPDTKDPLPTEQDQDINAKPRYWMKLPTGS